MLGGTYGVHLPRLREHIDYEGIRYTNPKIDAAII